MNRILNLISQQRNDVIVLFVTSQEHSDVIIPCVTSQQYNKSSFTLILLCRECYQCTSKRAKWNRWRHSPLDIDMLSSSNRKCESTVPIDRYNYIMFYQQDPSDSILLWFQNAAWGKRNKEKKNKRNIVKGVVPVARWHYYISYCHLIIFTCLHTLKIVFHH